MHKPLILVGQIGRAPAEPRNKPLAQKNAAEAIARPAAKTPEEVPLVSPQDRTADAANDGLFSASQAEIHIAAEDKAFRTLAAEFALAGYELIDEVGIDGARRLYVVRNGHAQHFDSLGAARAHLATQIGGSP